MVATFDDPPQAEVLRGLNHHFLLSPAIKEQAELETVFIDALIATGHGPHMVEVAADGSRSRLHVGSCSPPAGRRAPGRHRPARLLAPALYMEDLLAFGTACASRRRSPRRPGTGGSGSWRPATWPGRGPGADQPGPCGRHVRLTGPEALRFKDVAARISAVFAREVGYTDQWPGRAAQAMLAGGVSPWQADGNLELFDWIRQGGADTVTAAVREVTGADPQPVQDWLEESRADFEVPPLDLPRVVVLNGTRTGPGGRSPRRLP